MNTEWQQGTKYIVGVGLVIFGLFVLYLSMPIVPLLITSALIAFLLMPVVGFLHKRLKLPRGLAIFVSYLLLLLIVLLFPLLFIPIFVDGFNELAAIEYQVIIDDLLQRATETLTSLSSTDVQLLGFALDLSAIVTPALDLLQNTSDTSLSLPSLDTMASSLRAAVPTTLGFATNVAGTLLGWVLAFVFTILYAVYMSLDAHKLGGLIIKIVPRPYRAEIGILLSRLRKIWRAYFRGQLNLMFIIGLLTWVIGLIIGLPNAFTLAVIAGIMELIPSLGPFLAAIPAVIIALILGSTYLSVTNLVFALIVVGCYILIQQIENTFIVPRVLGEAVELPALVVLIGVVIGANIGGILGALLAAPTIASTREIVSYLYAKILGETPYPPEKMTAKPAAPSLINQAQMLLAKGRQLFQGRVTKPEAEPAESTQEN
jgi:predicted PurR-regulated permease PerM